MDRDRWQRLEALFEAARGRPGADRNAFLAQACGEDEELRRDVETLLAREDAAGRFLEVPAIEVAGRELALQEPASLAGRDLGPYRLESLLGAGGMGEVYRARDTRLQRDVAIEVLPPLFVADPNRRARFEREARLLAALNDPHIAAIYGLEDASGTPALVLELVEGPTLADRLAGGPLPLPEALAIARQITEALRAAHDRGIVHRDLKPANIKVTPAGVVKVLDFGIAKMSDGVAPTEAPTVTLDGTRPGVILGTAAYMSPEQARGQELDERTDVWAFGCVLYEMLTGRSPFDRDDLGQIAAVIATTPDWDRLPANTPNLVRQLLGRCLEKDGRRRLRDIGEARIALDDALGPTAAAQAAGAPPRTMRWRVRAVGAPTAGLLIVIAAAAAAFLRLGPFGGHVQTIDALAVLPFVNVSANPDTAYLSDGITDSLIDDLSQLPRLKVMSRNSVVRYRGGDTDAQERGARWASAPCSRER